MPETNDPINNGQINWTEFPKNEEKTEIKIRKNIDSGQDYIEIPCHSSHND